MNRWCFIGHSERSWLGYYGRVWELEDRVFHLGSLLFVDNINALFLPWGKCCSDGCSQRQRCLGGATQECREHIFLKNMATCSTWVDHTAAFVVRIGALIIRTYHVHRTMQRLILLVSRSQLPTSVTTNTHSTKANSVTATIRFSYFRNQSLVTHTQAHTSIPPSEITQHC